MAGITAIDFTVMKNGMAELGTKSPISLPGPVEPHYVLESYLTFEGFGLDEKRKRHYLDATVAYVQASSRDIEYLRRLSSLLHLFILNYTYHVHMGKYLLPTPKYTDHLCHAAMTTKSTSSSAVLRFKGQVTGLVDLSVFPPTLLPALGLKKKNKIDPLARARASRWIIWF